MLCTNCGQTIADGVPFCPNCGVATPQASGAANPPPQQPWGPASSPAQTPQQGWSPAQTPQQGWVSPPPPPPPPTMPGYGAGWQPPQMPLQMPPQGGSKRTGVVIGSIVAALIVLAGLGVGLYFGLRGDDTDKTTVGKTTTTKTTSASSDSTEAVTSSTGPTTTTEPAFVQATGEVFLEAAGEAGPESFTGETFLPAGPPSTLKIPTTTTVLPTTTTQTGTTETTLPPTTTTTAGAQLASYSGDTPALYGGSKSKQSVDKEGQLRFLEQNPDKAAAFCAALNADPTFKWSGGNQIQPSQLRAYFDELTPVMLTRDTRVTNHGFRDGKPTPRQSVLQKGQMVLVDRYGVPRVRCECGIPLTPPKPVPTTPTYTGPKWPDFDPTVIIVIQPTVVIIENLILIDIDTGDMFERPTGTEGVQDTVREATVWQLQYMMNASGGRLEWTAEVTLGPDGTLSGSAQGVWHCNGFTWQDTVENKIGTWEVDASYTVSITGTVEQTPDGNILHMTATPTIVSLDNWTIVNEVSDHAQVQADVTADMPTWLSAGFVPVDLPAPSYGSVFGSLATADGWQGSATLTAVR